MCHIGEMTTSAVLKLNSLEKDRLRDLSFQMERDTTFWQISGGDPMRRATVRTYFINIMLFICHCMLEDCVPI